MFPMRATCSTDRTAKTTTFHWRSLEFSKRKRRNYSGPKNY